MADNEPDAPGSRRRRGATLEAAILDAAWAELSEHGYGALTLEAVAHRAGTSRPVLHRRWPGRAALVTAALARQLASDRVVIPECGALDAELHLLLRAMSDRATGGDLCIFLDMQKELAAENSNFAALREQIIDTAQFDAMIARAVARGEVDPARLTPRITALPLDLARHELIMTFRPLTDDAIRQIIEDIFLPLVRPLPGTGAA